MDDYHNPLGDYEKRERGVISALANGNCKGSKAILELYLHAGSAIPAETLYNLENKQPVKNIVDKAFHEDEKYCPAIDAYIITSNPDCPIELTDWRTVDEVRKAIKGINYHLGNAEENNDLGRVEDLKQEREKLTEYLSECLTPTGKIRKTSHTSRKLTLALARDVKYYLDKLARTDPNLSNFLRDHVKIGKHCYWSDEPIKRKSITKIA